MVVPLLETDLAAGPTVLTDSLAMGAVVVATDVNGTRDYVVDGVTARLVPPGDDRALARAITELYENPTVREKMASVVTARARENLRPEPFVDHVLSHCQTHKGESDRPFDGAEVGVLLQRLLPRVVRPAPPQAELHSGRSASVRALLRRPG